MGFYIISVDNCRIIPPIIISQLLLYELKVVSACRDLEKQTAMRFAWMLMQTSTKWGHFAL